MQIRNLIKKKKKKVLDINITSGPLIFDYQVTVFI